MNKISIAFHPSSQACDALRKAAASPQFPGVGTNIDLKWVNVGVSSHFFQDLPQIFSKEIQYSSFCAKLTI